MIDTIRTGRRGFIAGAATLAAAGTNIPSAIASAPSFDTMGRSDLQDHVNSTFKMQNEFGESVSAKLVRIERLKTSGRRPLGVRRDSFAAIFKMDDLSSDSRDQVLTLSHPKLGKMDAYVQPIHSVTGKTSEVEVIFS